MNTVGQSSKPERRRMVTTLGIAAVTCLLCASTVLLSAQTQPAPRPFTKDDVVKLLNGNVPVKRVETLVHERGIDFQLTPEVESDLRRAGATDPLLAALRDLAPKPPTLVVTTTPGGPRVYIDDEFLDTTSSEGRLKLSTLAPGRHKLRVALGGYRDYEESIDLAAGKTLELAATLESNIQPSSSSTSEIPGASGANSPPGSAAGDRLTLPGNIGCGGAMPLPSTYSGVITVGNGRLWFSANAVFAEHSFDVPLSNVVLLSQAKSTVEFDVQFSDKKQHCGFWVYLGIREDDNVEAARQLYEALKVGSK